MYSLYADESRDDDSSRVTVAGYLIGSKRLAGFTDAWRDALGPLDYFHMKEGHFYKHPEDEGQRVTRAINHFGAGRKKGFPVRVGALASVQAERLTQTACTGPDR